jgi:toxin ParE1/3/4
MPRSGRPCRLSPLAEIDLEDIWLYTVRNWSAAQAERYHSRLMAVIDDLASGARTGRALAVRAGYLKYPVGTHFVCYRLTESSLDVIRILHQRMDVAAHLEEQGRSGLLAASM